MRSRRHPVRTSAHFRSARQVGRRRVHAYSRSGCRIQQSGPTAGVPTPYHDIAPRFGFAATLPGHAVLRGGYGLTYFPANYQSPYYLKNAPFGYSENCSIQVANNSANSCATAQFSNAAPGQFSNGLISNYGLPATNSASTVGQTGGAFLPPTLNIALATDPSNYKSNGVIAALPINLKEIICNSTIWNSRSSLALTWFRSDMWGRSGVT